jgi:septum formation protein
MKAEMSDVRLILASASPRRKQLLEASGYAFEVIPPQIDEQSQVRKGAGPAEIVVDLARIKAADVIRQIQDKRSDKQEIVVACDTLVQCGGQILGKPADQEHARQMLELLSGAEHQVYSGLCVWPLGEVEPNLAFDVTTLRMDGLSAEQLNEYLATDAWQGKAGAFGYQDGWDWLHILKGSESNVVGLPMELLARTLNDLDGPRKK